MIDLSTNRFSAVESHSSDPSGANVQFKPPKVDTSDSELLLGALAESIDQSISLNSDIGPLKTKELVQMYRFHVKNVQQAMASNTPVEPIPEYVSIIFKFLALPRSSHLNPYLLQGMLAMQSDFEAMLSDRQTVSKALAAHIYAVQVENGQMMQLLEQTITGEVVSVPNAAPARRDGLEVFLLLDPGFYMLSKDGLYSEKLELLAPIPEGLPEGIYFLTHDRQLMSLLQN